MGLGVPLFRRTSALATSRFSRVAPESWAAGRGPWHRPQTGVSAPLRREFVSTLIAAAIRRDAVTGTLLGMRTPSRPSVLASLLLWSLAFVITAGAAVYQRLTGPTHPLRVTYRVGDQDVKARLVRSGDTTHAARVEIPATDSVLEATLHARRYPTSDPFIESVFVRESDVLRADLPRQPAAGKVEYRLVVRDAEGESLVPGPGEQTVVLRYKDPVPAGVLIPHIAFMFIAMLVGVRTALAALLGHAGLRRFALTTLGLMTIGGLVLGPIVQKYAFGAFWTGWPFGQDLTDNKVLVMWLAWAIACLGLAVGRPRRRGGRRIVVIVAALVMLIVYLIPHSLRGSELDYDKLREGVAPEDAIRTGRWEGLAAPGTEQPPRSA